MRKASDKGRESAPGVEASDDRELKDLERQCHEELIEAVKRLAAERGLRHTNAINPVALRFVV